MVTCTSTQINVLLVDDNQLIREGLRRMLEVDDEIRIVAEATSGEEALRYATNCEPDIILMDVGMPGMNGIEATREIKKQGSKANIIILTIYEDKYLALAAEAGASGYLLKDIKREELVKAIKLAYAGKSPFDPTISRSLFTQYARMLEHNRKTMFSSRQQEVLRLIAAGNTNRDIAKNLFLGEATVKREMKIIFDKLNVCDRAHAVSEAYHQGLI